MNKIDLSRLLYAISLLDLEASHAYHDNADTVNIDALNFQ